MTTIGTVTDEPTAESIWQAMAGITIDDHLLEWPPDVFALTDTLLGAFGGVSLRVVAAGGGGVATA